jgi:hypothetical protein
MKAIKGFYIHLTVYIAVNLFLILIQALTNEGWGVFLHWGTYGTALFWGIGLAFHAFGVFGMDLILGPSWENRKIKEIMDRDKKQFWE